MHLCGDEYILHTSPTWIAIRQRKKRRKGRIQTTSTDRLTIPAQIPAQPKIIMQKVNYARKGLNRYPIRDSLEVPPPEISKKEERTSRSGSLPGSEAGQGSTTRSSPVDSLLAQDDDHNELADRTSYAGAQLVEPCAAGALCHILQPCGHKIMTLAPEHCAENCKTMKNQSANTNLPFACPACISELVIAHESQKRSAFFTNLIAVERIFGALESSWVTRRLRSSKAMWQRDMAIERHNLETLGRRCFDFSEGFEEANSMARTCEEAKTNRQSLAVGARVHGSPLPSSSSTSSPSQADVSRLPVPSKASHGRKRNIGKGGS